MKNLKRKLTYFNKRMHQEEILIKGNSPVLLQCPLFTNTPEIRENLLIAHSKVIKMGIQKEFFCSLIVQQKNAANL